MNREPGLKIAIIGGGVAGIVAAYLLQQKHRITLFEKNDYIGGHTHTIVLEKGPDSGTPVDTGFIVFNDRTYPLFNRLLNRLGVKPDTTVMSFSYACRSTGLTYASTNFNTLFADRRNFIRPSFWHLLAGIVRFNCKTKNYLYQGLLKNLTLGQYMKREKFSGNLVREYLIPMAAAIWSTSAARMMEYPAESFARFFENHGLLSITDQPQWYYVKGGSHAYVKAFLETFRGRVLRQRTVAIVHRRERGITVMAADGTEEQFDGVVIATHADEAYALLADPSEDETRLLSPWHYTKNDVVLHTDTTFLPANRRAWASWNYLSDGDAESETPLTVTYHMNRLQRLTTQRELCVTLNPPKAIAPERVIRALEYAHPLYTFDSLSTQKDLSILNGRQNTYFCGSYFGYGFHEDAVRSAVDVARLFGEAL
ncbi:MAG: FAD-dependent oxidoreductase [Deltaproteobacteria bacterium]|nr:FAD-dependent oxidoreductase [Deltaproteobacteria bacterium]